MFKALQNGIVILKLQVHEHSIPCRALSCFNSSLSKKATLSMHHIRRSRIRSTVKGYASKDPRQGERKT
jgi:hypothetical protein